MVFGFVELFVRVPVLVIAICMLWASFYPLKWKWEKLESNKKLRYLVRILAIIIILGSIDLIVQAFHYEM